MLIGENGTGKSTILEACELLRRAAGADFMADFHGVHGGMFSLLRDGSDQLRLGVRVEAEAADDENCPIEYEFVLVSQGGGSRDRQ